MGSGTSSVINKLKFLLGQEWSKQKILLNFLKASSFPDDCQNCLSAVHHPRPGSSLEIRQVAFTLAFNARVPGKVYLMSAAALRQSVFSAMAIGTRSCTSICATVMPLS